MKPIRLLAITIALLLGAGAFAQAGQGRNESKGQGSGQASGQSHGTGAGHEVPTPEEQLKVLTEKLGLTGEQQAKIKPVLQELHDATQKIVSNDKLSYDERLAKVRPLRMDAGKKIREFLTDDQKKKLELYLQGPHSEMHGDLHG